MVTLKSQGVTVHGVLLGHPHEPRPLEIPKAPLAVRLAFVATIQAHSSHALALKHKIISRRTLF
jgi:hypothetical protein